MDLGRQHAPLAPRIQEALARVVAGGRYILGPEGAAFEEEFARSVGARFAVGVANGTDAIHLILRAAGIGPGDDVITTSISAPATALAVAMSGARPVFADVDPLTKNVTPETVQAAWTPRTKAVLPVHLYGRPADVKGIREIAEPRGARVFEDGCQAHGARLDGAQVGTLADACAFSFYPTKNLGGIGDGGAVTTDDPKMRDTLVAIRNYGQRVHYHSESFGINSRLDEMQAAILRVKLPLLEGYNERRRAIARRYLQGLKGADVELPAGEDARTLPNFHLFVVEHERRDELRKRLGEVGVGTNVHYPYPLHLQGAFAHLGYKPGSLPAVERASDRILSLPMFPELTDAEVDRVCEAVHRLARR